MGELSEAQHAVLDDLRAGGELLCEIGFSYPFWRKMARHPKSATYPKRQTLQVLSRHGLINTIPSGSNLYPHRVVLKALEESDG